MTNNSMLELRSYKKEDIIEIADLFFNTVHDTACKDYTIQQLNAWASGNIELSLWDKTLRENYTIIAEMDEKIVGFGDIAGDYLNRMYIHEDYQGKGIGSAITKELEDYAWKHGVKNIEVHASITAKSFFMHRGYKVIKEQQVTRNGVSLTNFVMNKNLS